MKKLTKKKGNLCVVIMVALLLVLQLPMVSALAGDTEEKAFTFDFTSSDVATTREWVKYDATSVYMECTSSMHPADSYTAEVWGWCSDDGRQSCEGPLYSFSDGVYHYMTSYVHENDMTHAWVRGYLDESTYNGQGYFTGYWSPDSIYY